MPLQVAYATSSGVCRMPLQVAYATSSGARTVSMPLHATSSGAQTVSMPLHATSSGVCRMPLQVAYATSSGARTVSMPLHATSSGAQTVSMPLHATSSGVKWREVAKSVYAPPACSMKQRVSFLPTQATPSKSEISARLRGQECQNVWIVFSESCAWM